LATISKQNKNDFSLSTVIAAQCLRSLADINIQRGARTSRSRNLLWLMQQFIIFLCREMNDKIIVRGAS